MAIVVEGDGLEKLERRIGSKIDDLPERPITEAAATWFEDDEPMGYTDLNSGRRFRLCQDLSGTWFKVQE